MGFTNFVLQGRKTKFREGKEILAVPFGESGTECRKGFWYKRTPSVSASPRQLPQRWSRERTHLSPQCGQLLLGRSRGKHPLPYPSPSGIRGRARGRCADGEPREAPPHRRYAAELPLKGEPRRAPPHRRYAAELPQRWSREEHPPPLPLPLKYKGEGKREVKGGAENPLSLSFASTAPPKVEPRGLLLMGRREAGRRHRRRTALRCGRCSP